MLYRLSYVGTENLSTRKTPRGMERETGIEPAPSAWKAEVLPLNYSRPGLPRRLHVGGGRWIRTTEGVSQQIYSLPPLAAWVSLHNGALYCQDGQGGLSTPIDDQFMQRPG